MLIIEEPHWGQHDVEAQYLQDGSKEYIKIRKRGAGHFVNLECGFETPLFVSIKVASNFCRPHLISGSGLCLNVFARSAIELTTYCLAHTFPTLQTLFMTPYRPTSPRSLTPVAPMLCLHFSRCPNVAFQLQSVSQHLVLILVGASSLRFYFSRCPNAAVSILVAAPTLRSNFNRCPNAGFQLQSVPPTLCSDLNRCPNVAFQFQSLSQRCVSIVVVAPTLCFNFRSMLQHCVSISVGARTLRFKLRRYPNITFHFFNCSRCPNVAFQFQSEPKTWAWNH